jgi:hypothetical protein
MKSIIIFLSIFIALFSTQSCVKNTACENQLCSLEVRSFELKVVNSNGTPYVFDELQILDDKKGSTLKTTSYSSASSSASYLIFDDSNMKDICKLNDSFAVKVLVEKGGVVKASLPYVFKKDCCHVNKLSGVEVVTIP